MGKPFYVPKQFLRRVYNITLLLILENLYVVWTEEIQWKHSSPFAGQTRIVQTIRVSPANREECSIM